MSLYLDEKELARMSEGAARATPGPWAYKHRLGGRGCFVFSEDNFHVVAEGDDLDAGITGALRREDAEFIAAAREDVPLLVAEVRRLRAILEGRVGLAAVS